MPDRGCVVRRFLCITVVLSEGGVLLTLKSVGMVFLLLDAAMDWTISLCLRY